MMNKKKLVEYIPLIQNPKPGNTKYYIKNNHIREYA